MKSTLPGLVALLCWAAPAQAHIELFEPISRYPLSISGANKACPCGVGESNRLCDVPGDRSDPDRSMDRVTVLEAGSTVLFRWDEYIGHGGRYRVAIDYDGADMEDFNANILIDIPDPGGNTGNTGNGSIWELEVPLPDTQCDNCTLQLVQMMDGNTNDPVLDPIGRSSYYTCADVILVSSGTADAGVSPDGASGTDPDAGDGQSDPGGCGCHSGGPGTGGLVVALWLAFALRRHRASILDRR